MDVATEQRLQELDRQCKNLERMVMLLFQITGTLTMEVNPELVPELAAMIAKHMALDSGELARILAKDM